MPNLKVLSDTPASLGYRFPAEWEPHAGTWFSWPRPEGISFPDKYHTVPENLARIFRQIAPREAVHVNVPNGNYERIVRGQLKEHGCPLRNIFFHHIKTNESWCRDHGPAFVVKPKRRGGVSAAVVDWGFNAWGGKYPPYDDDDAVPTRVAEKLGLAVVYPSFSSGTGSQPVKSHGLGAHATKTHGLGAHATIVAHAAVIMEGGSVEFNGNGTVLTTTDCLLNKNRNPGLSKADIEQILKDYYGQTNVCWLTGGIDGDDTDGHIDDLARFISPGKLVMAVEDDPTDVNHKVLKSARKQVDKLRDQNGRPFEIIEIPMPGVVEHDGQRLPATYVNFYFVNGALLVPTYRHKKNDRRAIEILQSHLPKHQVIGIDCMELIWGLGAIHCLTQQMPRF